MNCVAIVKHKKFATEITIWKLLNILVNATLQLIHIFANTLKKGKEENISSQPRD
jgi:hypothetical protein